MIMQTKSDGAISKNELLAVILICGLIWLFIFTYSNIFNAGFNYFLDDHETILANQNHQDFKEIIIQPFMILWSSTSKQRFRPLYDVFVNLFTWLYGLNSFCWYLSSFVTATITTIVLYIVGRLQKFSWSEAMGFATLIVFGQQASTYARFGTPETTSTFLIALSFLCGSLNHQNKKVQILVDYLFVIFAVLAALNKEACILMLPALCFFKTWNLSQQANISLRIAFIENRVNIILSLTTFLTFIAYIKLNNISGPGYAGIDNDTLSISNLIKSLTGNGLIFGVAIASNIVYFVKYHKYQDTINSFYTLIALIIIPQLIIYNKSGMFWHYCLPAAIGVSMLTFWPIVKIRARSIQGAKILTSIIFVIISFQIIFTVNYFKEVSTHVRSIEPMISDISRCVGREGVLVIVGNPYIDYEPLYAFKNISNKILYNNRTFLATFGSKNTHLFTNAWQKEEKSWDFLDVETLDNKYNNQTIKNISLHDLSEVKGVVLNHSNKIEQPLLDLKLDWFSPKLNRKYYPELQMSVYCK